MDARARRAVSGFASLDRQGLVETEWGVSENNRRTTYDWESDLDQEAGDHIERPTHDLMRKGIVQTWQRGWRLQGTLPRRALADA